MSGRTPDQNQNLHFTKISRCSVCSFQGEKLVALFSVSSLCSRIFPKFWKYNTDRIKTHISEKEVLLPIGLMDTLFLENGCWVPFVHAVPEFHFCSQHLGCPPSSITPSLPNYAFDDKPEFSHNRKSYMAYLLGVSMYNNSSLVSVSYSLT